MNIIVGEIDLINRDIPEYNISKELKECESLYDQLHFIYEDALDNYNNTNYKESTIEYINYLEEKIINCENDLYQLRKNEFTIVEDYLYELAYLKNDITLKINLIEINSNELINYVKYVGYKKEDLISAIYHQNINNDNIDILKIKLSQVSDNISVYKAYIDTLYDFLDSFENLHDLNII